MRIMLPTLSTAQITGIVRTMRKLGDTKTVRLFVPVSEEMRDQFEASCNGETMASVMREMIAERIAKKPARAIPAMVRSKRSEPA